MKTKRAVDIVMTFLLLFLMSYQVTEQAAHEWLGMGMAALVILHQILNRKWYAALFRGKYGAIRVSQTCVNVLLLLAFAASAVSGMALSEYAVPFLRNLIPPVTARLTHLCASYWAFLLMGAHLGLHWGAISAKLRLNEKTAFCLRIFTTAAAAYGFFLFLNHGIPVYLACGTHFAFLDYETPPAFVLAENFLMLLFWVWISYELSKLLRAHIRKTYFPVLRVIASLLLGTGLFFVTGGNVAEVWNQGAGPEWETVDSHAESESAPLAERFDDADTVPEEAPLSVPLPEIEDALLFIPGGAFMMGSPETEQCRLVRPDVRVKGIGQKTRRS